jgi:hypothetical protein
VRIVQVTVAGELVCALSLLALTIGGATRVSLVLLIPVALGAIRSFRMPALQALPPLPVRPEHFAHTIAWSSLGFGAARIAGPGIAGILLVFGESVVDGMVGTLFAGAPAFAPCVRSVRQQISRERISPAPIMSGFPFSWSRQVLLGAISLDLFADLLGGDLRVVHLPPRRVEGLLALVPGIARSSRMLPRRRRPSGSRAR